MKEGGVREVCVWGRGGGGRNLVRKALLEDGRQRIFALWYTDFSFVFIIILSGFFFVTASLA